VFDSKIPITDHRGRKRVLWSNALFPSATADHVEREHARAARGLTPDPDHCTTCPECGAAWKLP